MIAHLRDPSQLLLAAARLQQRREAERGGELAAGAEALRLAHRSSKRSRRDHSDARDRRQALRQLVRSMPGKQLLLESRELLVDDADLMCETGDDPPSELRHIRCAPL